MPIIDCHQHLIYPEAFSYSWTQGIPQLAGRAFTLEAYHRALGDRREEVRTLFMESAVDDPDGRGEGRHVEQLAGREGSGIIGWVLNCRPEAEGDFRAYLEAVRHTKLVGLRRILHVVPDDTSRHPRFAANLALLAEYRLSFDLCLLSRQLPLALPLVDQCQGVRFILDHCGNPPLGTPEFARWREDLKELSRRPNVACKVSGIVNHCPGGEVRADVLRPCLEHVLDCFGWDRVLWGSDWPVVEMVSTLQAWLDITFELLEGESAENQAKILHLNAERLYPGQG